VRRFTSAVSVLLLALLAVGVAEASLGALLGLFSVILDLRLGVELGPLGLLMAPQGCCQSQVTVFNAGVVASFMFTAGCGLGAAAWRFRRWRAAP
jgi:hypothetical protein